jgi:hypothetical protein
MPETAFPNEGLCPRCGSEDIEREVIFQTTSENVSGVVFFCQTCALASRALASDREDWYDVHKSWQSPAIPDENLEAFLSKWPKKVGTTAHGRAEPLGPILPTPKR